MAHSYRGREIYQLHDNGFSLCDNQTDLTPIQKHVYLTAKSYHTEEDKKREEKKQKKNQVLSQGQSAVNNFKGVR